MRSGLPEVQAFYFPNESRANIYKHVPDHLQKFVVAKITFFSMTSPTTVIPQKPFLKILTRIYCSK